MVWTVNEPEQMMEVWAFSFVSANSFLISEPFYPVHSLGVFDVIITDVPAI